MNTIRIKLPTGTTVPCDYRWRGPWLQIRCEACTDLCWTPDGLQFATIDTHDELTDEENVRLAVDRELEEEAALVARIRNSETMRIMRAEELSEMDREVG